MAFATSRVGLGVDNFDDLKASLKWFNELLPATAKEELAALQRRGMLVHPVTIVDGRKNADEDSVKPFGKITYAESVGPLGEAIAMADDFVRRAAPIDSGHYLRSLVWFRNGREVGGAPDYRRVGIRGNVQLIDRAPYASTLEVQVPRGIIYGAFVQLKRRYGEQLSISFGYVPGDKMGGLERAPGAGPPLRPYAIPVLTIGGPASTVRPKTSRPGAAKRRRKRRTDRWQGYRQ